MGADNMSPDLEFQRTLAAAEAGDPVSMYYAAESYEDGTGVERDVRLAIRWYTRAARAGVVDAMYELARCYIDGTGIPLDRAVCQYWLRKAYTADHLITICPRGERRCDQAVLSMLLHMDGGSPGTRKGSDQTRKPD